MRNTLVVVLAVLLVPVLFLALLAVAVVAAAQTAAADGCTPGTTAADAAAIPSGARVAGFGRDRLANAALIAAAARTLGLDGAAQVLGIQAAIGESSLLNIDYGDGAMNPDGSVADSIGLFQQQHWWGSTADRMDPTKAATAFFKRLVTVRGWQQLDPTLAINRVQGNADPYYYSRFRAAATAIMTYLGSLSSASTPTATAAPAASEVPVADGCTVSGDAKQLAQHLVDEMNAGRLTFLETRYATEVRNVAAGTASADCGIDVRVLQIITFALQRFRQVGVSDLNRRCTTSLLGAGTSSAHWIHGGGQAVDIYALDGTPVTGGDPASLQLLTALAPGLPAGSRAGQVGCRAPTALPNMTQFEDTCNHLHLDVAFATGPFRGTSPAAAITS